MLDFEKEGAQTLRQIDVVRGAINGRMTKMVEDHRQMHAAHADTDQAQRTQGVLYSSP